MSWNVPTLHLSVTTAPRGAPWHAWPVVACGGMSIGHKGMLYAPNARRDDGRPLRGPGAREAIRKEFAKKKGNVYKAYIPQGPPTIPSP